MKSITETIDVLYYIFPTVGHHQQYDKGLSKNWVDALQNDNETWNGGAIPFSDNPIYCDIDGKPLFLDNDFRCVMTHFMSVSMQFRVSSEKSRNSA